jgi:ditrans,polycis-polyprenyl diphosphate synthase
MDLLERTLAEMGENNPLVKKHNLRVRVLGRLELLEDSVLRAVAKTMNTTKDNRGKIVNICVAYAGRDEIASAIRETVADPGVPSKITATSLTENMFMVYRLSDFMLWQCHQGADIEVVGMNWPDFGRWDIYMILLRWQSRKRASAYVWFELFYIAIVRRDTMRAKV